MKVTTKIHLRRVLIDRNLTQRDLHHMTGIREASISLLAKDKLERLQLDHLERIASALDIKDIRELITLEIEED